MAVRIHGGASDEGLTLEASVFQLVMVANLHFNLVDITCCGSRDKIAYSGDVTNVDRAEVGNVDKLSGSLRCQCSYANKMLCAPEEKKMQILPRRFVTFCN